MKEMKLFLLFIFAISALSLSSCYYDNEEYLYSESTKKCDTTDVSYSKTIAPIISSYCLSCHGATYKADGKNIPLSTYNDVVGIIDKVVGAVQHNPDYSSMPKNSSKLNACRVKAFEIWQANGLKQ
ncbi:MAG: hypothetical protein HW421_2965 [Ignavibacteria bacterium]|nr:hypothetical protein [Ignavibacteria bacterium]